MRAGVILPAATNPAHAIIDAHTPDVAWVVDYRPPHFSYASAQAESLLGYSCAEIVAMPLPALLTPNGLERVQSLMVGRLCEFGEATVGAQTQGGPFFQDVLEMRHRDGHSIWVEIAGHLFVDADGEIRAAGTARNITDHHLEYLHLKDSEERYRTAIQYSVTGMAIISASGELLEASHPFCEMLSLCEYDIRGTRIDELLIGECRGQFGRLLQKLLDGELDTFRMRTRFTGGGGETVWGDCSAVAVRRADGTARYVILRVADITTQAEAEAELSRVSKTWAEERERLRHTLDSIVDPITLLEAVRDQDSAISDFRYVDLNAAARRMVRRPKASLVGQQLFQQLPSVRETGLFDQFVTAIESQRAMVVESVRWVDAELAPNGLYFNVGVVPFGDTITVTWRDVSDQYRWARALAQSEERYRLLTANLSGVVVKITTDDAVDWVSPSLTETLGWRREDWLGHQVTEFFHPDDLGIRDAVAQGAREGRPQAARWRVADANGIYHWAQFMARPYRNAAGELDGMVGTFRIVDTEVAYELELERRARYDDLSGLLNRRSILDKVAVVVGDDRRVTGNLSAVLFCDIDLLKEVNDTYGHAGGDALIVAVASRMASALRDTDSVGRIGGDEFLVLLDSLRSIDDAMAVAEKIRIAVHGAVRLPDGGSLDPTLSIGVAITQPGEGVSALVERANNGLYEAKRTGRDRIVLIPEKSSGG